MLYIVVGAIVGALTPALIALAVVIWASVIPAFIAAAIALAPWLIGGAIIGGIVAGIMWVIQNWDKLKAKAGEVWNAITETIRGAFTAIGDYVMGKIQGIIDFYNRMV